MRTDHPDAASTSSEQAIGNVMDDEPIAWMLEIQMPDGDTGWLLSWTQSGAGTCERLSGDSHEKPLYLRPTREWAADRPPVTELLDLLQDMAVQHCYTEPPNAREPGLTDSGALSVNADVLTLLAAPEEQFDLLVDVAEAAYSDRIAQVIADLLTILKRDDWQDSDAMARLFDAARVFARMVDDRIDDAAIAAYDEQFKQARMDAEEARAESMEFDWGYGP